MLPSLLLFPVLSAASVSAGLLNYLVARGADEVYGGFNLTKESLDIAGSISSPTCNATESCQTFVKQVIPRCLNLQGTAGCWCGNHDPLHYCALCMSNPSDNTTNADQTQAATTAHGNYHRACAAYQNFLNATASGSATTSSAPSATAENQSGGGSSFGTGALVGVIIGGIAGVVIIIAGTFLIYRKMSNNSANRPAPVEAYQYGGSNSGTPGPTTEVKNPFMQMGTTPSPPPHFMGYTTQPMSPMQDFNPRESQFSNAYTTMPGTAHSDTASSHPGGNFSPPPAFVANPNPEQGYDTSMLHGLGPAGGKFGRAAEPM